MVDTQSLLVPDIQVGGMHAESKTCAQLAQDRVDEYAATLHFIGLLAGLVGTEEQRKEAKDAALEALRRFVGPTSLSEATRREEETRSELYKANDALNMAKILNRDNPERIQELEAAAALAQKNFDTAYADRTDMMHQSYLDLKESIWNFFKEVYENAIELIKRDKWKLALCKIAIETGFFIAENLVLATVSAAGFGAAAVVFKVVGKITKEGSRVVQITLTAARRKFGREVAHDLERSVANDVKFGREIKVLEDLTGDERRLLGERGQGNLSSDKKPSSPGGDGKGSSGSKPREPARPTRSNEELLAAHDGKVPRYADGKGKFNEWWNDLSPKELDNLWADDKLRRQIEAQIREPRGLHEWLKTASAPQLKRMGFSMEDIKAMTTATKKASGPIPEHARLPSDNGNHTWRHTTDDGKTGHGSKRMHDALERAIEGAKDKTDLLRRLGDFANDWLDGGVNGFPPSLRDKILEAGGSLK